MATAKPNYVSMRKAYESVLRKREDLNKNNYEASDNVKELRAEVRQEFADAKVRENFSFTELGRVCLGDSVVNNWRREKEVNLGKVREAAGVIGTEIFADISAQWMYQNVYTGYANEEEFALSKLIPEQKASTTKGEIIPGYTDLLNLPLGFRAEKDAFAETEFVDDWVKTPPTLDRGGLLEMTEEAIYDDKVGDLADATKKVGYACGVTREIDAVNCLLDENTSSGGGTVINYPTGQFPWRYAHKTEAALATYNSNTGNHTWDNLVTGASSALLDWTSLNLASQKFFALLNPFTGLPINVEPKHLIVPKVLLPTAERIARATSVRMVTPGYATTGNPVQTIGATPIDVNYQIISTRLLANRMSNGTASTANWYLGNVSEAFRCMVVFPLEILEGPALNPDQFRRRIAKSWRFSLDYSYVVYQPRAMVKAQGT